MQIILTDLINFQCIFIDRITLIDKQIM